MNLLPFLVVDDGRHFRSFSTWRGGKSRVPLVNETTFSYREEKEETRKKKGNKLKLLLLLLFVSCVCRPKRIKNGRAGDIMGRTFIFISSATGRHPPDKKKPGRKNGHTQLFSSSSRAAGRKKNTISIKKEEREDTGVSNVIPPPPFSPSSWIENHLKRKAEEVDSIN